MAAHDKQRLVKILQHAYSGELAAAYAYRGHWKSVTNPWERQNIQRIEAEEWAHRKRVGTILSELGSGPVKVREVIMGALGRCIGLLCHVTGWFLPMYLAGWLESSNVGEYRAAAFHAGKLGLSFEAEFNHLAAVEREHELFFMAVVAHHPCLPLMQIFFNWRQDATQTNEAQAIHH